MKYVTRARAKVDRIACPWLIKRFVDPEAEFLFVEAERVMQVAERESAIPFDVPNVELGHHGERCSFDAIVEKYRIADPALLRLAEIVRGADTQHRDLTPESAGLYALATGFHSLSPSRYGDDHALLDVEFPMYDALYEFCKTGLCV
ncbi:MAG TPA: chromate resistance protein ChrB domain-containing protein [Candidatus Baltobacteraceae bacterium]